MAQGLSRRDLQRIAQAKIDDALLLFTNHRFSNAYYLAGYAVEIGLKACIAKMMSAEVIPDKRFILDIHTHDLRSLVGTAGLKGSLKSKEASDPAFAANWSLACQWTPDCRYSSVDPYTAQTMIVAITSPHSGVLEWIKAHW